eukprot:6270550-Pyramimonas_sp.AAC.1
MAVRRRSMLSAVMAYHSQQLDPKYIIKLAKLTPASGEHPCLKSSFQFTRVRMFEIEKIMSERPKTLDL